MKIHYHYDNLGYTSFLTNADIFKIRGDDNGKQLFEFFADNTNVEWGHAMTGIAGDKGLNFITTGHDEGSEPGMTALLNGQLKYGYTVREINHSHPNGNYSPSSKDMLGAEEYKAANPNVKLQIYTHPNRCSVYDEKGTLDFGVLGPKIIIIETKNK